MTIKIKEISNADGATVLEASYTCRNCGYSHTLIFTGQDDIEREVKPVGSKTLADELDAIEPGNTVEDISAQFNNVAHLIEENDTEG